MDFDAILRDLLPAFDNITTSMAGGGSNVTGAPRAQLPNGFESLIPLFGAQINPFLNTFVVINNAFGAYLGLDFAAIVAFLALLWAACRLVRRTWESACYVAQNYLMASIHVSSDDDIYQQVLKWLAAQPHVDCSRALMAESSLLNAWEEQVGGQAKHIVPLRGLNGHGHNKDSYLNFSYQHASTPPRYVPAMGTHGFWFKGTYFSIYRKRESVFEGNNSPFGASMIKDSETMVLSCFSLSPEPIKKLLQHIREDYFKENFTRTVVKRPNPVSIRRYGGRNSWCTVANRPIRPMSTVVLDRKQKRQLLADINEYLHPETPLWYANRGIPLRRGYLFHGPPGTGKTSLSFALAGVFGLDIFVISLLDPALTEEDLISLFTSLPRRCVVLLEDIDTAGLRRSDDDGDDVDDQDKNGEDSTKKKKTQEANGEKEEDEGKRAIKAEAIHSNHNGDGKTAARPMARGARRIGGHGVGGLGVEKESNGISLSGLLNAIDGVASHEGRVLIMTTNKPDVLDEALIRPGRVDLQVAFGNATKEQACELFLRMYDANQPRWATPAPTPAGILRQGMKQKAEHMGDPMARLFAPTCLLGALETKVWTLLTRITPAISANGGEDEEKTRLLGTGPPEMPSTTYVDSDEKLQQQQDSSNVEEETNVAHMGPDELEQIAVAFGSKIPNNRLSPAEIQGFLLKRKKNPRQALREVEAWVSHMMEQKASKSKILQVQ